MHGRSPHIPYPTSYLYLPLFHHFYHCCLLYSLYDLVMSASDNVRNCFQQLKLSLLHDQPAFDSTCLVLQTILHNIIQQPDNKKYWTIRMDKPIVEQKIGRFPLAITFLELLGFEPQPGPTGMASTLKLSVDLNNPSSQVALLRRLQWVLQEVLGEKGGHAQHCDDETPGSHATTAATTSTTAATPVSVDRTPPQKKRPIVNNTLPVQIITSMPWERMGQQHVSSLFDVFNCPGYVPNHALLTTFTLDTAFVAEFFPALVSIPSVIIYDHAHQRKWDSYYRQSSSSWAESQQGQEGTAFNKTDLPNAVFLKPPPERSPKYSCQHSKLFLIFFRRVSSDDTSSSSNNNKNKKNNNNNNNNNNNATSSSSNHNSSNNIYKKRRMTSPSSRSSSPSPTDNNSHPAFLRFVCTSANLTSPSYHYLHNHFWTQDFFPANAPPPAAQTSSSSSAQATQSFSQSLSLNLSSSIPTRSPSPPPPSPSPSLPLPNAQILFDFLCSLVVTRAHEARGKFGTEKQAKIYRCLSDHLGVSLSAYAMNEIGWTGVRFVFIPSYPCSKDDETNGYFGAEANQYGYRAVGQAVLNQAMRMAAPSPSPLSPCAASAGLSSSSSVDAGSFAISAVGAVLSSGPLPIKSSLFCQQASSLPPSCLLASTCSQRSQSSSPLDQKQTKNGLLADAEEEEEDETIVFVNSSIQMPIPKAEEVRRQESRRVKNNNNRVASGGSSSGGHVEEVQDDENACYETNALLEEWAKGLSYNRAVQSIRKWRTGGGASSSTFHSSFSSSCTSFSSSSRSTSFSSPIRFPYPTKAEVYGRFFGGAAAANDATHTSWDNQGRKGIRQILLTRHFCRYAPWLKYSSHSKLWCSLTRNPAAVASTFSSSASSAAAASTSSSPGEDVPPYLLHYFGLSSANMSRGAFGEPLRDARKGEGIALKSWEFGVLFFPPPPPSSSVSGGNDSVKECKFVALADGALQGTVTVLHAQNRNRPTQITIGFPVPFQLAPLMPPLVGCDYLSKNNSVTTARQRVDSHSTVSRAGSWAVVNDMDDMCNAPWDKAPQ